MRPNVVFILTDQWRAQAFGYRGDPNVKTPNIDALARQCLDLQNAVSVCPVCTPARASLLTGRFPTTTGMFLNDLYLPVEEMTIGKTFKAAGYDTAYIGKWHLDGHGRANYIPPQRRQGFDYWKVLECTHDYFNSHYYAGDDPTLRTWEGYDAYAQTIDAQAYIRDHAKSDKPFFLFVGFGGPHFPHHKAPEDLKALYPPESIALRPNVPPEQHEYTRAELQGYYAHCTAIDRCVGDLTQTLDETGIAENTLFIFTSDHGDMHGSQGVRSRRKIVPWDESACVPFLFRWPGVHSKGRVVSTPLNTPDIFPTLCALAGIEIPDTIEGEDLSRLFSDRDSNEDRAALYMSVGAVGYVEFPIKAYRAIRTSGYTYVRDSDGPWLFYDNGNDPYQMRNLANDPEHAQKQAELEAELQRQLRRNHDEFPTADEARLKWRYPTAKTAGADAESELRVQSPGPEHGAVFAINP